MLRRCVQGIFRYRSKPRTTSTELQPLCDAQMRHPLTSSGLISEPYTWNANYEVEGVGCLNQIKLRYNTHIYIWLFLYIHICICGYIYIYRGCTKPCTSWYRKYSHIQIDQCCQHANWFPYLVHQPKTWDTSDVIRENCFRSRLISLLLPCWQRWGTTQVLAEFFLHPFNPFLRSEKARKGHSKTLYFPQSVSWSESAIDWHPLRIRGNWGALLFV